MLSVHAAVFPFDAQRSLITDIVQCDDDPLKVDVAMSRRAEIPITAVIGKGGMTPEDANRAVAFAPPGVLHMAVENALAK